jgi:hypothetical protein
MTPTTVYGAYQAWYELHIGKAQRVAFAAHEVEACKTHGSESYHDMAQQAELERAESERAEDERVRLECGAFWGWQKDSDMVGMAEEEDRRYTEAERQRVLTRRRALPRPLPGETPQDYACRAQLKCPTRYEKEHAGWYAAWLELVAAEMLAVSRGEPVE